MIRKLLTTTALIALLSTGAIAQGTAATSGATVLANGYVAVDTDNLASRIIGAQVYSSNASDADNFGAINDLIIDEEGQVDAAIIGVGGFLGIGEKGVAVDFAELEWTRAPDDSYRYVLNTTREALEAAPAFEWRTDQAAMDAASPEGTNAEPVVTPEGGAMDRSTLTDFDETSLTAEELQGTPVYGTGDEQIGTIGDFVLGDDGKSIDAVIVDVGGFLGLGKKPVAVGFENLNFAADTNNQRYLFLNTTKEQLEAQPEFKRDSYGTDRDAQRLVVTP